MLRSLGILLVALSLLGPSSLVPVARECPRCAEHCPMKKPRLPCHSATGLAIAGCSHEPSTGVELARDVGLLLPPPASFAAEVAARVAPVVALSPDSPLLEPPVDPPRVSFAV